jgi:hypothetical protein
MPPETKLSREDRMREICTSGTVRGEGGNILTFSALRATSHLNYCLSYTRM